MTLAIKNHAFTFDQPLESKNRLFKSYFKMYKHDTIIQNLAISNNLHHTQLFVLPDGRCDIKNTIVWPRKGSTKPFKMTNMTHAT